MKRRFTLGVCLCALLWTAGWAGAKESMDDHAFRVLQVDALSISVSFSKTEKPGAKHGTYAITSATVVTINGHPANARDLRGGMVTHLAFSPDQRSVTKIEARDAPAVPKRGHVG